MTKENIDLQMQDDKIKRNNNIGTNEEHLKRKLRK
jgi:hypothetical protein